MPVEVDPSAFLEACGGVVSNDALAIPRAVRLAALLIERNDVGAHLIEARANPRGEWLLVDVEVDVGQVPAADIRHVERMAIGFGADDNHWPQVVSLRTDFPRDLLHLFVTPVTQPVALCLAEEPWSEVRRRWTPAAFVRRLRQWLIDTARGALHRDEQLVEPFLPASTSRAILPADAFAPGNVGRQLDGALMEGSVERGRPVYRLSWAGQGEKSPARFVAAVIASEPRVHGVLHRPPRNLAELFALFGEEDPGFAACFDKLISSWLDQPGLRGAHPMLFVQAAMRRSADGPVERTDTWAFLMASDMRAIGKSLDLWDVGGEREGPILAFNRKPGPYGADIAVELVNPVLGLDPASAADANGRTCSGKRVVAVGSGALGSQVMANLARMGEAVTTVIDEDVVMPHNLARHAIWDEQLAGWPKADAARLMQDRLFSGAVSAAALIADAATSPQTGEDPVAGAIEGADLVLDMAASVEVSRRLALGGDCHARCMSMFLSPDGLDLVVLAEDADRATRLDHLEMAYYGAVVADTGLQGHMQVPEGRRYARSCRERSARIPQTAVALHASIAAEAVFGALVDAGAAAAVWRLDRNTMEVRRIPLDLRPMRHFEIDGWSVLITERLLDELAARRAERLPHETGGVLMGDFDVGRRIIYVAHHLPTPPDSIEEAGGFIRGSRGVDAAVTAASEATLGMLQYVGEWHSHPTGARAMPSVEDARLYVHLAEAMEIEDRPPIMLIAGEDEFSVVLGFSRGRAAA